jgi:acyl-CoA thioester hydrolase
MKNLFKFTFKVTADQIDHLNHVNNVVYVNWILDAAQKHWEYLSDNTMNSMYVWVVLRHEIDYLSSAKLNDEITVNTWVQKSAGVKSERAIEIKKGDKLIANALTTWCLLDKKTMKPVRIPSEILDLFN